MDTKLIVFALVSLLILALFTTVSRDATRSYGPIVYTRNQLIALRDMVVLPERDPVFPAS